MRKYKLFGKISILYVLIIFVLILALFFVGNKFLNRNATNDKEDDSKISNEEDDTLKTIRYTVEFENLSAMIKNLPKINEKVRDFETATNIGFVVSAKKRPYSATTCNLITGEPVTSVHPDRQNIVLVIEARAEVTDSGISINGYRFGVGRQINISLISLSGAPVVRNIEIMED